MPWGRHTLYSAGLALIERAQPGGNLMPLQNQDILVHFVLSAVISLLLFLGGVRPLAVLLVVLAIGVGKEALDANGFGTPSVGDMLANIFGMMSVLVLFHLVGSKVSQQQHKDSQEKGLRGAQMSLAMQRARKRSRKRHGSRRRSSEGVHYKVVIYESEEAMRQAHAKSGRKVDFRSQSIRRPDGRRFDD